MTHTCTHISLPDRSKLSVSLDVWWGNSACNSLTVSAFFTLVSQSGWSRFDVKGSPASPAQQDGQWEQHFRASGKRVSVGTYLAQQHCIIRLFWNASQAWTTTLECLNETTLAVMTFLVTSVSIPTQLTYCLWQAMLEITAHIDRESAVVKNHALLFSLCCQTFWLHLVLKESRWSV